MITLYFPVTVRPDFLGFSADTDANQAEEKQMSKILFVTAPYHCWGVQVVGNWPPLHLAYLAGAALEVGHEARIFDAMNKNLKFEDIRQEIER